MFEEWLPEDELKFCQSRGVDIMPDTADCYPHRLRECIDRPVVLFRQGECDMDSPCMLAVVGTRRPTAYGIAATKRLINDLGTALGEKLVVVSGLAYGIDICAHRAALESGIRTVAVVAHGLQTIYPADHRDWAKRIVGASGAIVTEYTSERQACRAFFLARNRIIAGLCDLTLVVESAARGGALVTARHARQYGRAVGAVPGEITSESSGGTNSLIANGQAKLIQSADDIIAAAGWDVSMPKYEKPKTKIKTKKPEVPADLQRFIDLLRLHPEYTSDHILRALDLTHPQLAGAMMRLELSGFLEALPGGRYKLLL